MSKSLLCSDESSHDFGAGLEPRVGHSVETQHGVTKPAISNEFGNMYLVESRSYHLAYSHATTNSLGGTTSLHGMRGFDPQHDQLFLVSKKARRFMISA